MIINHDTILNADTVRQCDKTGRWLATRSLNYRFEGWRSRLKAAWGVLRGKYDAFDWRED